MKICVFGAGAIGGHLAARLARGGAEVSVVARGAHLAAIQAQGIRVVAPDLDFTEKLHASADPAELGVQDAVLVTVKAPALPSVAASIAPLLGPKTAVVFVMNGIPWWYFDGLKGAFAGTRIAALDPADEVRRSIGPSRSIGGVVYSACNVLSPGVIEVEHTQNRLVLGEIDGTLSARMEAISAPLRAGGLTMDHVTDIRSAVWTKLLMNMAASPIAVLTGAAPKFNLAEPAVMEAVRAIYAEAYAVATALGAAPSLDIEARIRGAVNLLHKPSMLQDLELGRPMEVETILTTPLRVARMAGVATPVMDLIFALARLRAQTAAGHGGH
jgi:2-dehydropantoate 2-reductase